MAGHLAGKDCAHLFHLGLDQGMAGFVEHGPSAKPCNFLIERLRTLYFHNADGAWMLWEDFAPEEDHQRVAPYDVPAIIHHSDAVPVAIQPNAHIRMFPAYCHNKVTQVLRLYWIGMVMGKSGIRVAVQPDEIDAEVLEHLGSDETGSAISAVQHHSQPPGTERNLLLHHLPIGGDNVPFIHDPAA